MDVQDSSENENETIFVIRQRENKHRIILNHVNIVIKNI